MIDTPDPAVDLARWGAPPQQTYTSPGFPPPQKTTAFAQLSESVKQQIERDIQTMLQQAGSPRRTDLIPQEPTPLDYAHQACGMLSEAERHSLGIGLTRELVFDSRGGMHHFTYGGQPLYLLNADKLNFLAGKAFDFLREATATRIQRKMALLQNPRDCLPIEYASQLDTMLIAEPKGLPLLEKLVRELSLVDGIFSTEVNKAAKAPAKPPGKTGMYRRRP